MKSFKRLLGEDKINLLILTSLELAKSYKRTTCGISKAISTEVSQLLIEIERISRPPRTQSLSFDRKVWGDVSVARAGG